MWVGRGSPQPGQAQCMGRLAAVCTWEGEGGCLGHPPLTPCWPVVQVAPVPVAINPIPPEALDRWGSHCAAGKGVEPLAGNCCCFVDGSAYNF